MPELKPFRIYRTKKSNLWTITHRLDGAIRHKKVGETDFALSKSNTYIKNKVSAHSILGFADLESINNFTRITMKIDMTLGAEILYPEFIWEGGGNVGFTDVNVYTNEGRIFNMIPIPTEGTRNEIKSVDKNNRRKPKSRVKP